MPKLRRDSFLTLPTYSLTEASRLLRVAPSTLRWWLEGAERDGTTYQPVLRPSATGSSDLTWGEFVEAGYLREYRHDLPLQRLRPLIEALRAELGTPYPLATAEPMVSGRELVWNLQEQLQTPEELWIVVGGKQLVLGGAASAFFKRVRFDPLTDEVESYVVMDADPPVTVAPRVSFGIPTVRRVRTEIMAELVTAGEGVDVVVGIYRDYGITPADVGIAVTFEREYMHLAA
ncbi:MAG: DUF433 domain-containing protein [Actinobacteria bacterium]|nr:DUF433 domain-containing protein [Actinomycetota bacterium]